MTDANETMNETENTQPAAQDNAAQDNYHTVIAKPPVWLNQNDDSTTLEQCSICFNDIDMVNITVTRCGHAFHSSCIFHMMANGGRDCPLCRTKLAKDAVEEEEQEYDEDWGSDIEEDEPEVTITNVDLMVENEEQTYEHSMSIETLAQKLLTMGYTNVDILRLYIGNSLRSETPEKYTRAFCSKLSYDIEETIRSAEQQPQRIMYSLQELREYCLLNSIDNAMINDDENETV